MCTLRSWKLFAGGRRGAFAASHRQPVHGGVAGLLGPLIPAGARAESGGHVAVEPRHGHLGELFVFIGSPAAAEAVLGAAGGSGPADAPAA